MRILTVQTRSGKECYRVIQPGCRLCVNIGDQFAGRLSTEDIKSFLSETIVHFCEKNGFDYMGAIITAKVTCANLGGATVMGSLSVSSQWNDKH